MNEPQTRPETDIVARPQSIAIPVASPTAIQSLDIAKIAGALAKAQGGFEPVLLNKHVNYQTKGGGRVTYSYADLSTCINATRKALSENGIAFTQTLQQKDQALILITQMVHESGQWMRSVMKVDVQHTGKMAPLQEVGSSITYLRRYSYCCMCGITSEEDTDVAEQNPNRDGYKKKDQGGSWNPEDKDARWRNNPASDKQRNFCKGLLKKAFKDDAAVIADYLIQKYGDKAAAENGGATLANLTAGEVSDLISELPKEEKKTEPKTEAKTNVPNTKKNEPSKRRS